MEFTPTKFVHQCSYPDPTFSAIKLGIECEFQFTHSMKDFLDAWNYDSVQYMLGWILVFSSNFYTLSHLGECLWRQQPMFQRNWSGIPNINVWFPARSKRNPHPDITGHKICFSQRLLLGKIANVTFVLEVRLKYPVLPTTLLKHTQWTLYCSVNRRKS